MTDWKWIEEYSNSDDEGEDRYLDRELCKAVLELKEKIK